LSRYNSGWFCHILLTGIPLLNLDGDRLFGPDVFSPAARSPAARDWSGRAYRTQGVVWEGRCMTGEGGT
jgi:hypothetical protein